MSTQPQTFDQIAEGVFRSYLHSAVIIDDEWPEDGVSVETDEDESRLIGEEPNEIAEPPAELGVPPAIAHPVASDAVLLQELQRALLNEGLLTCGFRYRQADRDTAIRLAERADVVVLDWDLVGGDNGAEAIEILRGLRKGLRFVCIFTGQGRVEEVRQRLESELAGDDRLRQGVTDSIADFSIGNLLFAIRNKRGLDRKEPDYLAGPDDLFKQALRGFNLSYGGLVKLAMLELTQRHRDHLPEVLVGRFPAPIEEAVDAAVLIEAGDDCSPVAPGGSFLSLLIDEWRAHLEQDEGRSSVLGEQGLKAFGSLLAGQIDSSSASAGMSSLGFSAVSPEDFTNKTREWLCEGCPEPLDQRFELSNKARKAGWKAEWAALEAIINGAKTKKEPAGSAEALLCLDVLFHQQLEPPTSLTQGTVVSVTDSGSEHYLICITPACDAERPGDGIRHMFTFVKTERIKPGEILNRPKNFRAYCAVEHGGKPICLKVILKQKVVIEIKHRRFEDGAVKGVLSFGFGRSEPDSSDSNRERKSENSIQLRSIAQLRRAHALSLAAAVAADSSRVGVDRVEMIRRQVSE